MERSAKRTLSARHAQPRKSLGQNFLTDPNILAKIAAAAPVTGTDTVLEIGPGLGHLTRVLAARAKQVIAVELDKELAENLTRELASEHITNVRVIHGDILQQDLAQLVGESTPYLVVANIPYYITSAVIRHLLTAPIPPRVIVLTVQREVAQRLVAQPPRMNLLAVSVQFYAQVKIGGIIPAGAFYPRPKIDSAFVIIEWRERPLFDVNPDEFFRVVRAGFSAPRKQLRNTLAQGLGLTPAQVEFALAQVGIAPTRRPETLTLAEWTRLAQSKNWLGTS